MPSKKKRKKPSKRQKWDERSFELFLRDLLTWSFVSIRDKSSFKKYLKNIDYADERLEEFSEWFYREWDYYGDCCGEIIDSALYNGKLLPLCKDINKVSFALSASAFRSGGSLHKMVHWQINQYIDKKKIEFGINSYYQLLLDL